MIKRRHFSKQPPFFIVTLHLRNAADWRFVYFRRRPVSAAHDVNDFRYRQLLQTHNTVTKNFLMSEDYLHELIAELTDRVSSLENQVDELKKLIPDKLIKRLKEVEEKAEELEGSIDELR